MVATEALGGVKFESCLSKFDSASIKDGLTSLFDWCLPLTACFSILAFRAQTLLVTSQAQLRLKRK
jgi:hypothetical protein